MADAVTLKWLDRLIWTLIYSGLLALVLGLAIRDVDGALSWGLVIGGGVVAAIGFFLIWVRSRLRETAPSPPQGQP